MKSEELSYQLKRKKLRDRAENIKKEIEEILNEYR